MPKIALSALLFVTWLQATPAAQPQAAAVQPGRFVGTWVGTQGWNIANPPPGARQDQPVTLTIELVEDKLMGTMKPFLGGEDGAAFVDVTIVGEELHASAVVGRPRTPPASSAGGGRRGPPAGWKDPIKVSFVFKNAGVRLDGTADVVMGDVPWLKFRYELEKKRSRY
jgi:hypothetical protein